MKNHKIIYWVATGILTLIMLFSVWLYLFNHQAIVGAFKSLGYPPYLVYPLAVAKLLGLVAVLSRKSDLLKNLAYAGFFYDFVLAFTAHIMVGDSGFILAGVAIIVVTLSFFYEKKVFASQLMTTSILNGKCISVFSCFY